MAWSKNTNPEIKKAYHKLYYWRVTRKKRLEELKAMEKVCPICGVTFKPTSKAQTYCSEECRKESYRRNLLAKRHSPEYQEKLKEYRQSESFKESQKKYRQSEKFKEYKREYQKEYYRRKKAEKEQAEQFRQTEEYQNTVAKVHEESTEK